MKKGSKAKKGSGRKRSVSRKGPAAGAASPKSPNKGKNSKYLFILFFLFILVMAFMVIRPFLATLVVAAILAYVLYPVYRFFYKHTRMKAFSAIALIVILLLLSLIPVTIVTGELTKESYTMYSKMKGLFLSSGSFEENCASDGGPLCSVYDTWNSLSERYDLGFHLARGFSSVASSFVGKASDFILNIPALLLKVFVALFAMFYMLTQGEEMLRAMKRALPMSEAHSDTIISHFNDIIHATIYGAIVIAMVQGALACIGYFIFGVSSPIILGLLTVVAAFIPFVGASLVWLPVSLSMLITGWAAGDQRAMVLAGGLLLYGALIVSTIDNILRPKIVGERAKVHPLVILLGVLGGIAMFGFVGILIGPLLLTLFIASLRIYEEAKGHIR